MGGWGEGGVGGEGLDTESEKEQVESLEKI